jgi:arylsulfatase A-like enzyme
VPILSCRASSGFALLLTALLGSGACRDAPRPNVILISIDTLRADHLGCYGYARNTSPAIDAFRRDAVLFEQSIAHAPSTLPSHASIFTSLLPSHHRASVARSSGMDPAAPTLPEILREAGYQTASFNGGIQLDPLYGLARGFETYESARPSVASAEVLVDPVDRFDHAVARAAEWIRGRKPGPFFLFLHTYEIHHPYTPDPERLDPMDAGYFGSLPDQISVELLTRINAGELEIDDADRAHIVAAYDAELASVDAAFGRLVELLRTEGLYEESIVVVTSDHGEEFGEHGFVGWHSHSLYDELLRVPLLIKLPGSRSAGLSIAAQVRGIDLAPTILEELTLPIPDSFEGESLVSAIARKGNPADHAVSQKDVAVPEDEASIRTLEWKWTQGRLFHLASDPLETVDVSEANRATSEALSRALDGILKARSTPPDHHVEPDEELLEKLRSLGYIK